MLAALLAAPAASAQPGGSPPDACTPQMLMGKVATLTELLERQMQQPRQDRPAVLARMREAAERQQSRVVDYKGVCEAYDDLIVQLRN